MAQGRTSWAGKARFDEEAFWTLRCTMLHICLKSCILQIQVFLVIFPRKPKFLFNNIEPGGGQRDSATSTLCHITVEPRML